jgi:hypothetical protein
MLHKHLLLLQGLILIGGLMKTSRSLQHEELAALGELIETVGETIEKEVSRND